MKIFDSLSMGSNFLEYLSKQGIKGNACFSGIRIKKISRKEDYVGYTAQRNRLTFDILFTKTILKNMKPFISPSFIKLMLSMAENDFPLGKNFRQHKHMKSLIIPGTRGQKVLEFCTIKLEEWKRQAHILIEVGESSQWDFHGNSRSSKNGFAQKASQRQKYYEPIYKAGLVLAQ